MEMFYNEATKISDEVEDCQSPDGLGPTENSFDLTALIFENTASSQNDGHYQVDDELNLLIDNVDMTPVSHHIQASTITTTDLNPNLNPTQLKLEESVNLTSIAQTSLTADGEDSLGINIKKEPNPKATSHHNNSPYTDNMPDYRSKRDRNNVAVRKSREKTKEQQKLAKERVDSLRQENKLLENKVAQLQSELRICRNMFLNAEVPVPQALEDVLKKT